MHLVYRGVNEAFTGLVSGIQSGKILTHVTHSRVGEVLQIEEPVIITYQKPKERVLFNQARDANPFFHLYESLWMLAGRSEIAPLDYYSGGYSKQVQDGDSLHANGAYGYRWRYARGDWFLSKFEVTGEVGQNQNAEITIREVDQLDIIVDHLKRKPESRRVVLQMWNVADDLLKIDTSKDVACNLSVCFLVEDNKFLNMTVFNRSNDLIWGALGANVVHFSILQEYMATRLGLEVGVYNQVSNNLHVYTERWQPEAWLKQEEKPVAYGQRTLEDFTPLVRDPVLFDQEVQLFVDMNHGAERTTARVWKEPFLLYVAQPICDAFYWHKQRNYDKAFQRLEATLADDWLIACRNWLKQRYRAWEEKQASGVQTSPHEE